VGKDFSQFQEKQVKRNFKKMVECFFAIMIFLARLNKIKLSIGEKIGFSVELFACLIDFILH